MGIALEQVEGSSLIKLDGAIDIACAAELKAALLDALKSGGEIHIALEDATYLDVTAIQLLSAAEREAKDANLNLAFNGPVPEAISLALRNDGFEPFHVHEEETRLAE